MPRCKARYTSRFVSSAGSERLLHTQEVGGSNPPRNTKRLGFPSLFCIPSLFLFEGFSGEVEDAAVVFLAVELPAAVAAGMLAFLMIGAVVVDYVG